MKRSARRTVVATVLAGAVLVGGAMPASALTPASKAHWGWYTWGSEQVPVRAFWLLDRTGNDTMHQAIETWASVWNDLRGRYMPSLPYVAVYRDDANVGACYHTGLPQYSLALACAGTSSGKAVETSVQTFPTVPPHIVSPFMRLHPALDFNTMFTVVCHGMGIMMGLGASDGPTSCMRTTFAVGELRWYDGGDAATAVELYNSHPN